MSKLVASLLSFFLSQGTPGGSVYSFELMPECGTDPSAATCSIERVCALPSPLCAPPRFSKARGGWVRVESRAAAERRWLTIFESAERVANRLVACVDENGSVLEDCERVTWPGKAGSLARVLAVTALHESGFREDVQSGFPPAGRGPANEVCLVQVMPAYVAANASWLTPEERKRPRTPAETEELARTLLGTSPAALDRCFEVGARMLSRARRSCAGKGFAWDYSTWAAYGTGGKCSSVGIQDDFAAKRAKTLARLEATMATPPVTTKR